MGNTIRGVFKSAWKHCLFPTYVCWGFMLFYSAFYYGFTSLPGWWVVFCVWMCVPHAGVCGLTNEFELNSLRLFNCELELEKLKDVAE